MGRKKFLASSQLNNVWFLLHGGNASLSGTSPSLHLSNSGKLGKLMGWAVYLMGTERKITLQPLMELHIPTWFIRLGG